MTTTANPTFDKKTVYHSGLRGAGKLTVMFTSEVLASTYKGKPPYVCFKVEGDTSKEYQYNVENDAVGTLIKSIPRNQWVQIEATGTKEDADIEVTHLTGGPPAQQRQQSAPASEGPPPEASGESLARVMWRCLIVATSLEGQYEEKFGEPMNENTRAMAISLAIEVHRGNRLPLSV